MEGRKIDLGINKRRLNVKQGTSKNNKGLEASSRHSAGVKLQKPTLWVSVIYLKDTCKCKQVSFVDNQATIRGDRCHMEVMWWVCRLKVMGVGHMKLVGQRKSTFINMDLWYCTGIHFRVWENTWNRNDSVICTIIFIRASCSNILDRESNITSLWLFHETEQKNTLVIL